jgi:TOMM system kinase/cyclase fusion protein
MTLPTDSQWARYSALCARLRPLPTAARQAQLEAWQAAGAEDPQVLSLVALHWALRPDPGRDRTGERLGNFTLEAPLGAGGMGVVYRAQQHISLITRPVAVKLIHPALLRTARGEALARFQAEMGMLVRLEHEGIARIYDGGIGEDPRTHDPCPYIAMELVHGGLPLTTYARDYALPWLERLTLFVRVCQAVRYAHEHRVVHRDLKPTNILVDHEGRPFVIDFGLASACDMLLPGAPLAASGTPAYMSPEQVSPAWGAVSDRSDVYALGLLLYELLTGQSPYVLPRDGAFAQWQQVITEAAPPPLRQVDATYGEELETILAAALAKRPTERLSVAVLRARLERYLQMQAPARAPLRHDTSQAQRDTIGTTPGGLAPGWRTPDAERRQLTILFCDLVESTALATQLDPEDLREVIRAYHTTCAAVIQRFDGHIAQYLGDGLLVYFGYPQAHEDDAQRAVRAGLGMVDAVGQLHTRLERERGVHLRIRLGIHTGLVVVGDMGSGMRREPLALGEPPNLAARLQGLAAPNTVVLSAATLQLLGGFFACQPIGTPRLKGVAQPLEVYQVLAESTARSRLEAAGSTGLTPLVGREQEVGLLLERWAQVKDGLGQVVLLSGEAGIGKSRLVQVLKEHVATEPQAWLTPCQCSPYHQHTALYPMIELLERVALRFEREESPLQKLSKLEGFLVQYGLPLAEAMPLFATLLSLPLPADYAPLTVSPAQQKQQTLRALLTILLRIAAQQPVLFVMEDLHWVDPSTLEMLNLIVDQGPTARILALWTFRSDFIAPWRGRSHLTQVTLPRLPRRQTTEMIGQVAHRKALPAEVVEQVVAKTDGVPLFVEELTKAVLESGLLREEADRYELVGPLPPLAIPTTLQDSLMARLDRLATVKAVAQLGATIGRMFPYDLLHAVAPLDEGLLQSSLRQLVEAELLYQQGLPPQSTYVFKHVLIQDTAYQSLLRSTRQQYHQRIAQVLAERFPETAETQPEQLAYHYTEAGLPAQALPYWQRAGQQALQRSANLEAVRHLTIALEVLATLPDTQARAQQELDVQLALGPALMTTKGPTPEVAQTYARARALCTRIGETPQLFPMLWGIWRYYWHQGGILKARELGEQLCKLAQRTADPTHSLEAHTALGSTLFHVGDYAAARTHLDQGIALTDLAAQRAQGLHHGEAPGVRCLGMVALTLWCLGYPTQAVQRSQEALALAQTLAHPYSLSSAQHLAAFLHQRRREAPAVQGQAEALLTLATAQGFQGYVRYGTCWQGWAFAMQGRGETGRAQLRQGLAAFVATGQGLARPLCLVLLAEAAGHAGQVEEGLHLLAEARTTFEASGRGDLLTEAYRLQGAFFLRQATSSPAQAEACFQQALAIARRQQAKAWELRAATSLSRLWQQQGKRSAARELLAPIYGWFTEGFDTADLLEAKALLEALR